MINKFPPFFITFSFSIVPFDAEMISRLIKLIASILYFPAHVSDVMSKQLLPNSRSWKCTHLLLSGTVYLHNSKSSTLSAHEHKMSSSLWRSLPSFSNILSLRLISLTHFELTFICDLIGVCTDYILLWDHGQVISIFSDLAYFSVKWMWR